VVLDEASQKELDSVIKDIFKIVAGIVRTQNFAGRRGGKRMKKSAFIFSGQYSTFRERRFKKLSSD